jgi:membrane-associated phospholipid phosphatase
MRALYKFIDLYPDLATFVCIVIASIFQITIGNDVKTIILSISLMLPTLLVVLPVNVLIKRMFKVKRPRQYYQKKDNPFEGSFPSFHSQFSAGEATTFIVGIAVYSPEDLRLAATFLAIVTVGLASLIIAWSRIALKVHYPLDVACGFVLGVITGLVIPYAMTTIWYHFPLVYHVLTKSR